MISIFDRGVISSVLSDRWRNRLKNYAHAHPHQCRYGGRHGEQCVGRHIMHGMRDIFSVQGSQAADCFRAAIGRRDHVSCSIFSIHVYSHWSVNMR